MPMAKLTDATTSENESSELYHQPQDSTIPSLDQNVQHETTSTSPDEILTMIGCKNIYILLIWVGTAICWALAAMPMMVSTFFMNTPCVQNNLTTKQTYDNNCLWKYPCEHLNGTLSEEFGLVDEDDLFGTTQLSTAIFLMGIIVGAIVLLRISDRIGRHPVLCFSLIMSGIAGSLSSLAPYIEIFMAFRFIQGICFPGAGITNWVLAYESIPPKLRSYTALLFGICWVIGYCLIGPMAYLLPNWRWLAFSASIPSLLFGLFYINFLPESFHWLASNGDEKGIETWIRNVNCFACKFGTKQIKHLRIRHFCIVNQTRCHPKRNNEDINDVKQELSEKSEMENDYQPVLDDNKNIQSGESISTIMVTTDAEESSYNNLLDRQYQASSKIPANPVTVNKNTLKKKRSWIDKSQNLVCYTIILAYLWTCNTFIYYGLSLFSTKLVGDVYLNYIYVGLVEIPSYIVSPFLLDRLGRKVFISLAHFTAALTFIAVTINDMLPEWTDKLDCPMESLTLTMWLIGKFAISCSFTSLFVFASEIFPTASRNSSIGICAASSRIGATMVPFVKKMPRVYQLGLYCAGASLGGILTLFLPETKDKKLPSSPSEIPKKKKRLLI